jgi:flagellar hook assembly protein FlgD
MSRIKALTKTFAMLALTVCLCSAVVTPINNTLDNILTNYPNPFDSRTGYTTIIYNLSAESEVKLIIYDLLGDSVREFPGIKESPGLKKLIWDGTDGEGNKVGKGGYVCVLEIQNSAIKTLCTRKIGVIH